MYLTYLKDALYSAASVDLLDFKMAGFDTTVVYLTYLIAKLYSAALVDLVDFKTAEFDATVVYFDIS